MLFQPGLDGNDVYGDCTVVSLANMIRARAALNGFQAYVDPQKVIDWFAAASGDPPDLAAVGGLDYLGVVNRQAALGFDTGHDLLFGVPGVVDTARTSLAAAMVRFGSVGIGVTLHESDIAAFQAGTTWDVTSGAVVGGHAVVGWDYDADTVRFATWGTIARVSWNWLAAAIDEAHALDYPQEKGAA